MDQLMGDKIHSMKLLPLNQRNNKKIACNCLLNSYNDIILTTNVVYKLTNNMTVLCIKTDYF